MKTGAEFITFFALQGLAYFVLVANIRALAHLNYPAAAVSESVYLVLQWTVLRKIVTSTSPIAQAGYVIGGVLGSMFSMYLTRAWG